MAKAVILSTGGETIYPATIPDAIIDPNTGNPINLSMSAPSVQDIYTINNQNADESGNFTITSEMLNAAGIEHTHEISDIIELQDELDNKSNIDHTHEMVTGVSINGSNTKLSGDIKLIRKK